MDFDPRTGTCFFADGGGDGTNKLYTFDPTTGTIAPIGSTGLGQGIYGLAFTPLVSGQSSLLGSSIAFTPSGAFGVLYDIDIATGRATNPRTTAIQSLMGIFFSPTGVLYGISAQDESLYTIDPLTGASTLIGSTGLNVFEGDLDFQPQTGVLFGIGDFPAGATKPNLFTVNTTTGQGTVVGSRKRADLSAMAFSPTGALFTIGTAPSSVWYVLDPNTGEDIGGGPLYLVPEPATVSLTLLCTLYLAVYAGPFWPRAGIAPVARD